MSLFNIAPSGFNLTCTDAVSSTNILVDPGLAPAFMYYAYIPVLFFVTLIILWVARLQLSFIFKSQVIFIGVLFLLLIGIEAFLWISVPVYLTHFMWQVIAIIDVVTLFMIASFASRFLTNKPLPINLRWVLIVLTAPILLLSPTTWNMISFDIGACESIQGPLWWYIYSFEVAVGVVISVASLIVYMRAKEDASREAYMIFGLSMLIFMLTKVFGDIISFKSVNFLWPLGVLLFFGTLAYVIIRYGVFQIKLISTQVWVVTLVFFIFAALFVRTIENVRIVLIGTLVLAIFIGVFLVRSVRREMEQRGELERLNTKLLALDQQKNEFLHMASHQLRTPITSITGYTSMIQDGELGEIPDTVQPYLTKILTVSRLMNETINDYLNIARIEDGSVEYKPERFSLGTLVEELAENVRVNAEKHNLTLVIESLSSIKVDVYADKMSITQVVNALLENAIKYTKAGSVTVSGRHDTATNTLSVSVKDSGIGVASEEMHKLFQKFSRTQNAKDTDTFGTGMGLYIAKELIEANKGTISVSSEGLNKGSTFTISLPKAA